MESNGDAPISAILTRSKKLQNGGDEFSMLKNISEEQHEVKSLIQDQIYHNFVEVSQNILILQVSKFIWIFFNT